MELLSNGNVRVACKIGVLNQTYAQHNVTVVPGAGNNWDLLGLEEAYIGWQGLPRITECEAALSVSAVGGKGME